MIQQIIFECNYCTKELCAHYAVGGDYYDFSCRNLKQHNGSWVCSSSEAQVEYLEKMGVTCG
jgi:hypothetical protein